MSNENTAPNVTVIGLPKDVDDEGESKQVNVKVTGSEGTVVHFKIKTQTQLKKLKQAYCDRQGCQMDNLRFMFDGNRIQDYNTPQDLNLEDDDTIEVFQHQTG